MSIRYIGLGKLGSSTYHYSQCDKCGNEYPHTGPYPMCNGRPIFKCNCSEGTIKLPLSEEVLEYPEEIHLSGLSFEPTEYGYWRFNFKLDFWVFEEFNPVTG